MQTLLEIPNSSHRSLIRMMRRRLTLFCGTTRWTPRR
ncbi:hypothetical protein L915_10919 [Phytophthora nicotianae]|uniref:Uncharacterized protein n=1 Tax=Phytophthora nicotianae TaxID=4792 RepID=W2N890_PHYNI|nr:hypothetical protein L915_10919 [Phytophthora nicotianae]ETM43939.1 hypothetical protein L914_10761 [Phytophthora nicotianae]